jgi:hypothetical protein
MSSSLVRLVQIGYALALVLIVSLLVLPNASQAQVGNGFGVSTGWRATPALPVLAYPVISASTGGIGGNVGGIGGIGGVGGGNTNVSGSFSTSIQTFDLGSLFPNHGQIIGLPPPTFMPPLNNQFYDSTAAPWAQLLAFNLGGGIGIGGGVGGVAFGGGGGGLAGAGGLGMGGIGGIGGIGGGGFAGKGMGGFNGKKPI